MSSIHGRCLCGAVTFDVQDPQMLLECHCGRCRTWTGCASTPAVVVPGSNLQQTTGHELVSRYQEEGFSPRYFCAQCGTSLWSGGPDPYYVNAGVLEDPGLEIRLPHPGRRQGRLAPHRRRGAAVSAVPRLTRRRGHAGEGTGHRRDSSRNNPRPQPLVRCAPPLCSGAGHDGFDVARDRVVHGVLMGQRPHMAGTSDGLEARVGRSLCDQRACP